MCDSKMFSIVKIMQKYNLNTFLKYNCCFYILLFVFVALNNKIFQDAVISDFFVLYAI